MVLENIISLSISSKLYEFPPPQNHNSMDFKVKSSITMNIATHRF